MWFTVTISGEGWLATTTLSCWEGHRQTELADITVIVEIR